MNEEQQTVIEGTSTEAERQAAIQAVQQAIKAKPPEGEQAETKEEANPEAVPETKAEEVKPKEATPEEPAEEKAPEPEEKKEDSSIDYKRLAEKYKESLDREKEIARFEREKAKRLKKHLKKTSDDGTEDTSEGNDIQALIDQALEEKLDTVRTELTESAYEDALDEITHDPHEREAVDAIYKTILKPTGVSKKAIAEDVRRAWLIAHEDHIEEIMKRKAKAEVKQADAQKAAMTQGKAPTSRRPVSTGSNLSPEERALFDNLNIKPDVREQVMKQNNLK